MARRNYIIYCDESAEKGRYYSHFYGGVLINAQYRERITKILNDKKEKLNFGGELKWTKISSNYEEKYIEFIDRFMDFISENIIKCRIMFTQNIFRSTGLDEYQIDNQYFLLYYQLLKHAFGLRYCNPESLDDVRVSIYLDDIPDSRERFDNFKDYLESLSKYPVFSRYNIQIPKEEITDVRSHEHVIMQGLDIILGAMQFRLNNLHKEIPTGGRIRGKRTRAKERVYKHINKRIRDIHPNFNIGISTGTGGVRSNRWDHPYRHWRFIPSEHEYDKTQGKKSKK